MFAFCRGGGQVRHDNGRAACRFRRLQTVWAVLQHDAVRGVGVDSRRCRQKDVGRGLGSRDLRAEHRRREVPLDIRLLQVSQRLFAPGGRCQHCRDVRCFQPAQQFPQPRLDRHAVCSDDLVRIAQPQVVGRVIQTARYSPR